MNRKLKTSLCVFKSDCVSDMFTCAYAANMPYHTIPYRSIHTYEICQHAHMSNMCFMSLRIKTYIIRLHTYIHTYIHIHIHTCTKDTHKHSNTQRTIPQTCKHANTQTYQPRNSQTQEHKDTPKQPNTHTHTNPQTSSPIHTSTQTYQHTDTQTLYRTNWGYKDHWTTGNLEPREPSPCRPRLPKPRAVGSLKVNEKVSPWGFYYVPYLKPFPKSNHSKSTCPLKNGRHAFKNLWHHSATMPTFCLNVPPPRDKGQHIYD